MWILKKKNKVERIKSIFLHVFRQLLTFLIIIIRNTKYTFFLLVRICKFVQMFSNPYVFQIFTFKITTGVAASSNVLTRE